jgi:hypothetical protein
VAGAVERAHQYSEQKIKKLKLKFCQTINVCANIRSRTLILNKDIAKWLATVERKILRRIFGGIKVNENWRAI